MGACSSFYANLRGCAPCRPDDERRCVWALCEQVRMLPPTAVHRMSSNVNHALILSLFFLSFPEEVLGRVESEKWKVLKRKWR